MSNLQSRIEILEQDPAARIARVRDGLMPISELTDAEIDLIIDDTPPELAAAIQALIDDLQPGEDLEQVFRTPFEDMPAPRRALCETLVEIDKKYSDAGLFDPAPRGNLPADNQGD